MTKLLDDAIEAARGLPPDQQDDLACIMLQLAASGLPFADLTAEEEAGLAESEAQAARGEFASDE